MVFFPDSDTNRIALEIYSTTIEWIEVLNEVLHACMDCIGDIFYYNRMDSSRDLQSICTKSFVNRHHLILYTCVQIFDVMFLDVKILDDPEGQTPVHVVCLL